MLISQIAKPQQLQANSKVSQLQHVDQGDKWVTALSTHPGPQREASEASNFTDIFEDVFGCN